MRVNFVSGAALVLLGFVTGATTSLLPRATAATSPAADMSQKKFLVSIDEVRKNFVFGDEFSGSYKKSLILSDGSQRDIELIPMIHNGKQVVEFKDTGGYTYMSLNGTTTNGTLMVQLADLDSMNQQLEAEGWNPPKK